MNTNDPWSHLRKPIMEMELQLIRVDSEHPWGLYWGRSAETVLLVARLNEPCFVNGKLPSLRGLRVAAIEQRPGVVQTLMVELLDNNARDFFHSLCRDIVDATRQSPSEQHLINEIVSRTWMWHRFLQKGRIGRLSEEEQRGLIGELTALSQHLIPLLGPSSAVEGWTGPVGTARDFEYGATCLEVKTRRAAALPYVEISSEFQLDPELLHNLFLEVIEVTAAYDASGRSLNQVVDEVRSLLAVDGDALELLDERLAAAGYLSTDDYSEWRWSIGEPAFFCVSDDFPSIRHSQIPDAVSGVTYRLSLQHIEPYRVTWQSVGSSIRGQRDGDDA